MKLLVWMRTPTGLKLSPPSVDSQMEPPPTRRRVSATVPVLGPGEGAIAARGSQTDGEAVRGGGNVAQRHPPAPGGVRAHHRAVEGKQHGIGYVAENGD